MVVNVVVCAWGASSEVFLRPLYAVKGLPSYFCYPRKKWSLSHPNRERRIQHQPDAQAGLPEKAAWSSGSFCLGLDQVSMTLGCQFLLPIRGHSCDKDSHEKLSEEGKRDITECHFHKA